jgi:hypothetical protein
MRRRKREEGEKIEGEWEIRRREREKGREKRKVDGGKKKRLKGRGEK